MGKVRLEVINPRNKRKYSVDFVVVSNPAVALIGALTSQEMKIISVNHENILAVDEAGPPAEAELQRISWTKERVFKEFSDFFENKLGSLKGEIDLKIDTSVRPTQLPTRKVPVALRGQLRDKLDRLEAMGVISRVNDPTDWVSSLVITQKRNGSNRVCV